MSRNALSQMELDYIRDEEFKEIARAERLADREAHAQGTKYPWFNEKGERTAIGWKDPRKMTFKELKADQEEDLLKMIEVATGGVGLAYSMKGKQLLGNARMRLPLDAMMDYGIRVSAVYHSNPSGLNRKLLLCGGV